MIATLGRTAAVLALVALAGAAAPAAAGENPVRDSRNRLEALWDRGSGAETRRAETAAGTPRVTVSTQSRDERRRFGRKFPPAGR